MVSALIQANADTTILRVLHVPFNVDQHRGSPDAAHEIEIDYARNQSLVDDILNDQSPFRLNGAVLTKDGQVQNIVADGAMLSQAKLLKQYVLDIESGETASLTPTQRVTRLERAFAFLARTVHKELMK